MKKFIKWLAKVFKVNTEKEVVKEKKVYIDRPSFLLQLLFLCLL